MEVERFKGWALLELMGHRRRAGFVEDVEAFGTRLLRIDIPVKLKDGVTIGGEDEVKTTEFYGGGSIYGLHPCDEVTARKLASTTITDSPIHPYTQAAAIAYQGANRQSEFFDGDEGDQ